MLGSWKYYNHALIPNTEPHKECSPSINNRAFWKNNGGGVPLFARWTTDWDCGYETNWWYIIKDTPFDISSLKAKRRYEISKGKKNFRIQRIDPMKYTDEMLEVTKLAYSSWPEKYRPSIHEDKFKDDLKTWRKGIVYGGFDNENGELCGYSYLTEYPEHLEFSVLRVCPDREKKGINAAMVAAIVEDYNSKLGKNFYINDGARSIRHETAFQDYLEKYFGFRKAYCKLHICYRFPMKALVKILFKFKDKISTNGRIGNLIAGVLKMEEIARN